MSLSQKNVIHVIDVTHGPLVILGRSFDKTFKYPFHTCRCKMIYNVPQGFTIRALFTIFNQLTHLLVVFIEFKNRIQKNV